MANMFSWDNGLGGSMPSVPNSGGDGSSFPSFGDIMSNGGATALGGLFDYINYQNPADAAMPYLDQAQNTLSPYYQPYINAGQNALGTLQGQYSDLLNNPGGKVNQIGSSFQQSPGFQFAMQQALQGANHAAAAGGMAGSPQNQQQNMQLATNLANQDYYNYLGNAENMYGQGLQGEQGINNMGYGASTDLAQSLANMLMSKAMLGYQGANNSNQSTGGDIGSLLSGAASIASLF